MRHASHSLLQAERFPSVECRELLERTVFVVVAGGVSAEMLTYRIFFPPCWPVRPCLAQNDTAADSALTSATRRMVWCGVM